MTLLERMLRWIALAGIFALPFIVFIVAQTLFFPYITGKNFAFRIIVEIITGAWLALALVRPEYRPRRSWLLAAFAVFILIVAVADASGVNPFKSFWSNYERMDGWVTLAHLFAYFVVASSILNTEKLWRRFWLTSLGISIAVGVYGLLQLAGISALGQGGTGGLNARLDATFGNPIYLAAFMLFNIFIAALLWVQSPAMRDKSLRTVVSFGYGGLIALDILILFFTGTRGTILGLIGGVLLGALILVVYARGEERIRRAAIWTVAGIIIVSGAFWLMRDAQWINRVGFLDRLATISVSDNTVKARFMNWGMAWQGVKERPLLGWGQENYAIVFDKYYDPQMYAQEQWFDRVHNIIFDWLVAAGFIGLLSYLSIIMCALWCIWRADVFSVAERAILSGLIAGYFFHNLFVFDNITSYVLFTSVLAFVAWRTAAARNAPPLFQYPHIPYRALPAVTAIVAVGLWGVAWFVNANALAQNRTLLQAIAPQAGGLTKNLEYFKEAIAYKSAGTQEAREQLVQAATQITGGQNLPDTIKKQFLETASSEIDQQAKSSPLDARFPLFLGVLLDAYGNFSDAKPALERAHELSPQKQTILFELAYNAQMRGDNAQSLQLFKEAYELAPDFNSARIYYAAVAIALQKDQLADELLAPLMQSGAAADPRITAAYVTRGRYDKIVTIWRAHVKAQPTDAQARFTLAAALFEMGNHTEAIAVLEDAGRDIPSTKTQADSLIEQIRSGTVKIGQ